MDHYDKITEDYARTIPTCPGCGQHKGTGCIVCWDCFKYRIDITPLKYSNLSLPEWLRTNHIGLLVPVA